MNKNQNAKTICNRFIREKEAKGLTGYLTVFWSQFQSKNKHVKKIKPCEGNNHDRKYKLNLLKAMTGIILNKPDYILRCRRREGFNENRNNAENLEIKNEQLMYILSDKCFICGSPPHHRHHIIQLQYGGRNIYHNIVHLCRKCHIEVHR